MKLVTSLAVLAGLAAAPAFAATTFSVTMNSAQEVPPTSSSSVATGTLALSGGGGVFRLSYDILFDSVHDFGPVLFDSFGPILPTRAADDPALSGSDVTRLHIHNAPAGSNGGVVYGIINPDQDADGDVSLVQEGSGFRLTGEWDQTDAGGSLLGFIPGLLALTTGQQAPLYFNLHTVDNPGGAIRGQITATNNVSAIPLPAAAPLLLAGLASLAALRRRR